MYARKKELTSRKSFWQLLTQTTNTIFINFFFRQSPEVTGFLDLGTKMESWGKEPESSRLLHN